MKKFLTNIDLNGNELQNAVVQKVASDPVNNLVSGRIIYNTTTNEFKYYNGERWVSSAGLEGVVAVANGGTGANTLASGEVLIGNGTNAVQTKAIDSTVTAASTNLVTSGAVAAALNAIDSMTFAGTIDSTGVITSSITAINDSNFTELTSYTHGWVFVASQNIATTVIDLGAPLEAGDMILTLADATTYNTSNFSAVETNKDGHVTGPSSSADGNIALFNGATGKIIKDGGTKASFIAHSHTVSAGTGLSGGGDVAVDGDVTLNLSNTGIASGTYAENTSSTLNAGSTFKVAKLVLDEQGRVTGVQDIEMTMGTFAKKYTAQNASLAPSGGVCTWNVEHNLNTTDINVTIYDNTTHQEVITDIATNGANSIVITLNSADTIAPNSYTVVVIA